MLKDRFLPILTFLVSQGAAVRVCRVSPIIDVVQCPLQGDRLIKIWSIQGPVVLIIVPPNADITGEPFKRSNSDFRISCLSLPVLGLIKVRVFDYISLAPTPPSHDGARATHLHRFMSNYLTGDQWRR